ncbi:response regulator [Desulfosediminicola flagellatus]|uniref:response regulator n=1 Tax=Desulfosediminicola flagellatus TaxID=2569541 RepID=UPI0010ABE4E2|nr:response regulator [Desulfosediminicola flagellatus]
MTEHATARVLLVDDEEGFLHSLSGRLKVRGLRVNTSLCGEDALNKLEEQEFDAIVVDLFMPGMDGIETLKRIKESHPGAEVIMLTGHGSIKSGIATMKEGACDFLEKPVEISLLLEKIEEARSRRMLTLRKRSQDKLQKILKSHSW